MKYHESVLQIKKLLTLAFDICKIIIWKSERLLKIKKKENKEDPQ